MDEMQEAKVREMNVAEEESLQFATSEFNKIEVVYNIIIISN
jgi:hypothetical protein